MKRLTKKDFNICNVCARGPLGMDWDCDGFPACGEKAAYDRLAAYEDTGLEPEEIVKIREDVENGYMKSTARRYGVPVDRLRELAQADREGRCVVLPCKLGDTVFKIGASICMWRETDHCDEYCNGYEYRDCWEGCRAVCEDKFSLDDLQRFGKNVFLTREAAEAALKAREQDG